MSVFIYSVWSLWMDDPPSKESYRLCMWGLRNWKSGQGPKNYCRADRYGIWGWYGKQDTSTIRPWTVVHLRLLKLSLLARQCVLQILFEQEAAWTWLLERGWCIVLCSHRQKETRKLRLYSQFLSHLCIFSLFSAPGKNRFRGNL
jgi:hypothetical protein